jgi:hypothetical protein
MKDIYSSATKLSLLLIIIAIIWLAYLKIEVTEPLKSIALVVISFYFWNKSNNINP